MFNNLISSRPTGERRWTVWLIAAALHVLVFFVIVTLMSSAQSDETYEVYSEPILLEDVAPPLTETKPTRVGIEPNRADGGR